MARPTKLNRDIQNKIVTAIRMGNYIETAAAVAGINKTTLYDWLKRGEREKQRVENDSRKKIRKSEAIYVEFSNAVEKALAEAEARDVMLISKAANTQWQAAAWRLERKFPDRWGRKVIEHRGSLEVKNDDSIKRIEKYLEQDTESREFLKEFFRRIRNHSDAGADTGES